MSQESQEKPGGNTKTPVPKYQLYVYLITLPAEEYGASQLSQLLKGFCKKFTFQKEKGEKTGYEHWQIAISLKNKEYWQTVKNLFPASAHIEGARDGFKAFNYCCKDETRIEGPYNEKSKFLRTIENLLPWQKRCKDILLKEPDDRTIYWVWDKSGSKGKTVFCKYMAIKHKAEVLNNGGFGDLAYAISDEPEIVLFNLPRTIEERVNYGAIEAIKDGMIFSPKYESKTKIFNNPHVMIFANFEPNFSAMSSDRWIVIDLEDEK